MTVKAVCFWCDAEVSDEQILEHQMSHNLSEEEKHVGMMLATVDFCDHYCCGMLPMICRAKALARLLKERDE